MIQFNLLPDVKLAYIRAGRLRRMVVVLSVLVTVAAVIVVLLMLGVTSLQRKHLSDLNADIKAENAQIASQKDLNKILTVQNQLESIKALHDGKPAVPQLAKYLNEVTPVKANISNIKADFTLHTLSITGTADALVTVNQYVDTLKFTTYAVKGDTSKSATKAFSNVVLSSFSLGDDQASYTINVSYDPNIFDITKDVDLTVPEQETTRSKVDQPSTDLFTGGADTTAGKKE
jgi:cell division protein FtsB